MNDLTRIASLLKDTMGMDATTIGRPALTNAVRARMRACGIEETGDYQGRLQGQGAEAELSQLIEQVVVPETWFFRAPEAFAALAGFVRNDWPGRGKPDRVLRLLSAPSSTGEEPYSMAMTLLDAGLAPDRFRIDALDISGRVLALARRGSFGRNSFRSADLGFRDRWFEEVPGGWRICQEARETVRFRQGNLVDGEAIPESETYDVIFCRNVLIYFDGPTQDLVLRRLARCLNPDGLLFVGPSETFAARTAGFSTLDLPGAFACRRNAESHSAPWGVIPSVPQWVPMPVPALAPAPATFLAPATLKPAAAAFVPPLPIPARKEQPPAVTEAPAPTGLQAAVKLADSGQLREALRLAEDWIKEHPDSADGYCLLGVIRDAMGDLREAERQYRKALYLNPSHAEALPHLSFLREKLGDAAGAQRLRDRAQRRHETADRI